MEAVQQSARRFLGIIGVVELEILFSHLQQFAILVAQTCRNEPAPAERGKLLLKHFIVDVEKLGVLRGYVFVLVVADDVAELLDLHVQNLVYVHI